MKISKELYTFFKEWLEYAESANPPDYIKRYGLCNAVCMPYPQALEELCGIFSKVYNEVDFPFSNKEGYTTRLCNETQHLCPKRLAFVREQIALYESYVENE